MAINDGLRSSLPSDRAPWAPIDDLDEFWDAYFQASTREDVVVENRPAIPAMNDGSGRGVRLDETDTFRWQLIVATSQASAAQPKDFSARARTEITLRNRAFERLLIEKYNVEAHRPWYITADGRLLYAGPLGLVGHHPEWQDPGRDDEQEG